MNTHRRKENVQKLLLIHRMVLKKLEMRVQDKKERKTSVTQLHSPK